MNPNDLPNSVTTMDKERKKYNGVAARILNLLIAQATQEQAAKAVGVDKSYVSQLCAEEDFQLQVVEGIKTDIEKIVSIDADYIQIERDLLTKLKTMIPFIHSTDQIARLLRQVNEAKRKTQQFIPNNMASGSQEGTGGGTSTIIIPTFIQQQFTITPNREIVGINDRPLVTLDAKALNKMVESKPALPNPENTKVNPPNAQSKRSQDPWGDI